MLKAFTLFAAIILFLSCSSKKTKEVTASSPFQASPLDSVYGSLRPAVQRFTIDNSKVNSVQARNATEVLIPADCFTRANGDKAEKVEVEIVEALSLPDFVTSGLTTLSNGRLLLSNGMMYINARAGNEVLQLKEGASLTVSMPTMTNNKGYQLFRGDGRNWKMDSTMTSIDYAMPLPLKLLYPEGNKIFWTCILDVGEKDEKTYLLDTNIVSVTKAKYENTIIATEEFQRRIGYLREMMNNMSYFTNRDYYFGDEDCTKEKYNYDIFKVYFDHPERSFRESDSIAKKMYLDYFEMNKERIERFCEEVNVYKRKYYSNWTDTNYYFDFRKISLEEQYKAPLKNFPAAEREIVVFNYHGVNPDAPDAYEQLSAKGVKTNEINRLSSYHFRQKAIIGLLQKEKDAIADKNKLNQIYESTVFSVSKMGWINCDRFFDDPSAGRAVMYVSNQSTDPLNFVDYSLVIPGLNVRLSAYFNEGRWSFTKKDGAYTKLPIGRDAVITGVSLQNDSVFFGHQKIKIKDGLSIALPMKYIDKNSLRDSLAGALKL